MFQRDPKLEQYRKGMVPGIQHNALYDPAVQGAVLRLEPTGTPFDPTTYKALIFDPMSPGPATLLVK